MTLENEDPLPDRWLTLERVDGRYNNYTMSKMNTKSFLLAHVHGFIRICRINSIYEDLKASLPYWIGWLEWSSWVEFSLFRIHVHKNTIHRIQYCNIRYIRNSEDNTKSQKDLFPLWSSKWLDSRWKYKIVHKNNTR